MSLLIHPDTAAQAADRLGAELEKLDKVRSLADWTGKPSGAISQLLDAHAIQAPYETLSSPFHSSPHLMRIVMSYPSWTLGTHRIHNPSCRHVATKSFGAFFMVRADSSPSSS